MADFKKDFIGEEDLRLDTERNNGTFSKLQSDGTFANFKKINAQSIPVDNSIEFKGFIDVHDFLEELVIVSNKVGDLEMSDAGLLGYKGFFADENALVSAFPTAKDGDFALNLDTDSIWMWDTTPTTPLWIDTSLAANDTTIIVADITARDALTAKQGDVTIVTDSDGLGNSRTYKWDGTVWIAFSQTFDITTTVADITTRDALVAKQGDVAVVTDGDGDGNEITFKWSGAAWISISPASIDNTTTVADITARDALNAIQGDVAVVTDGDGSGNPLTFKWDGSVWVALTVAPAAGGILPDTTPDSFTGNITIIAGDIVSPIKEKIATGTVDQIATIDVSLLTDSSKAVVFTNDGTGRLQVVVSNTGTMTFGAGARTDFFIYVGDPPVTVRGHSATVARLMAGF